MRENDPDFIDVKTSVRIAWDQLWRMIRPVHELGNHFKQSVQPFLPGDEPLWLRQTDWLQALYRWIKAEPSWLSKCMDLLQKAPAILTTLQVLENRSMLQISDVFQLKQWLLCGRELTEQWNRFLTNERSFCQEMDDGFITLHQFFWEPWLRCLQPAGSFTPTFAWSDLQDSNWLELTRKRSELEQILAQQTIRQNKTVYQKVGLRPDRERRVIIQKPIYDPDGNYEKQREACFHCEELKYLAETKEETVFAVVDDVETGRIQNDLERLQSDIHLRQRFLLQQISAEFAKDIQQLKHAANEFARVDYFLAIIRLALSWREICWGHLSTSSMAESSFRLHITKGWHPVYRLQHEETKPSCKWTAIDLELSKVNVITGPNMGGKSVSLHTIALLQTLFQHGLPLPAESFAGSFCSWVRYHGGDDSDAGKGISSFAAEIIRLSEILQLPGKGLVLFDELARSTNPYEGEALAAAIVDTAFQRNTITVCASHFSRVGQHPDVALFQVKGLSDLPFQAEQASPQTDDIKMLLERLHKQMNYELIRVNQGHVPHYAFTIAARLGLPPDILERATQHLKGRGK